MGSLRFPDRTLPRSHECSTSPGSIGFVHRCAAPVVSIVAGLLTILALAALPTTAAGAPPAAATDRNRRRVNMPRIIGQT